jgi:hypothetical protein
VHKAILVHRILLYLVEVSPHGVFIGGYLSAQQGITGNSQRPLPQDSGPSNTIRNTLMLTPRWLAFSNCSLSPPPDPLLGLDAVLHHFTAYIIFIPHNTSHAICGPIRPILDPYNSCLFPFCVLIARIFDIILSFKHSNYVRLPVAFHCGYSGVHLWPRYPNYLVGCVEVSRGGRMGPCRGGGSVWIRSICVDSCLGTLNIRPVCPLVHNW